MKIGIVSGKYDPLLDGHISNIYKASKLCDYLIIITHQDYIIERVSKKKFNATSLRTRCDLLKGLILLYKDGNGEVMVGNSLNGESAECLQIIRKKFPDDDLVYCKGGDRVDPTKMALSELKVCLDLNITILYGIGELLSSSTSMMLRMRNKIEF
jgi:cytidyltransferase-like protein